MLSATSRGPAAAKKAWLLARLRGSAARMSVAAESSVEERYRSLKPQQHVLQRPDMYVGSPRKVQLSTWVVPDAHEPCDQQFKSIEIVPAFVKIFDEILVNVADNFQRTKDTARPTTRLDVTIDAATGEIAVANNGRCVDVAWHSDGKYCPELVFGDFHAGSNFDDSGLRVTGGRNGIGAKATNALSEYFKVEIGDATRRKLYRQAWHNNMQYRSEPVLEEFDGEEYTKITFKPLYRVFEGLDSMDENHFQLFACRVADMAACCEGLLVTLNGVAVRVGSFEEYILAKYECAEDVDEEKPSTSLASDAEAAEEGPYSVAHDVQFTKVAAEQVAVSEDGQVSKELLTWEIGVGPKICDNLSFVNSIHTSQGGTHVTSVRERIVDCIREYIKDTCKFIVHKAIIREHISVFVNCQVGNPEFSGQTKDCLTFPSVDTFDKIVELPDEFLESVCYSDGIITPIVDSWRARCAMDAEKAAAKRARKVPIQKLEDANLAGTKSALKCTLIVTEGDSAKSLALAGLAAIGRKYFGVLPLRGKLLNVSKSGTKKVEQNAMLSELQRAMGLDKDKTYDTAEELATLRYGSIALMCDQDHDGSHIKGLVINFLATYWRPLLESGVLMPSFEPPAKRSGKADNLAEMKSLAHLVPGKRTPFVKQIITPLIKAFPPRSGGGRKEEWFFSVDRYNDWRAKMAENGADKGWRVKYYKGLGTSTSKEGREYFDLLTNNIQPLLISFKNFSPSDHSALRLAFDDDRSLDRRAWLTKLDDTPLDTGCGHIPIEDFINKDLAHFFWHSCQRALPSCIDGLKPSQRKVLFTCFQKNIDNDKEIKVAQLGGAVAELTSYHHGEQSLHDAIVNLAQDFVGSGNNVPLLVPIGQFGTRLTGGSDHASARYISTRLSPLTRMLFPREDDELLALRNDEGRSIEPVVYVPIIPTLFLNGSAGIGTGHATNVPSYDPLAIVSRVWLYMTDPLAADSVRKTVKLRVRLTREAELARLRYQDAVTAETNRLWRESGEPEANRTRYRLPARRIVQSSQAMAHLKASRTALQSLGVENNLVPWYHGHSIGFCPKMISDGVHGVFDSWEEITELPVGEWTESFKGLLDVMLDKKLILTYESNCTDVKVSFVIQHHPSAGKRKTAMARIRKKLKKKIQCNITAFSGDDQTIVNFGSVEEVLVGEFMPVREALYVKRRSHLLETARKEKAEVEAFLAFADVFLSKRVAITDAEDVILAACSHVDGAADLLKRTRCASLSRENVEKKNARRAAISQRIDELTRTSPHDFWKRDLLAFVSGYVRFNAFSSNKLQQRLDACNAPEEVRLAALNPTGRVLKETAGSA
ncbi:DNA topoisomerase 2 [Diplonema papillatum]|nr:DNA topoisomerase 2 [Diplonema papillatum]